jgi:hypothetical protein
MTRHPTPRRRRGAHEHNGRGGAHDPITLWLELRAATEVLFDALEGASTSHQAAAAQRKLFLALELQCKLQELAVLPALQTAGVVTKAALRSSEEDIAALRELVVLAQAPSADDSARELLMAALDNQAELQFETVQGLLYRARHSGRSDGPSLRKDMDELLERWRSEIARTGDIEDEDIDPVGLPPR